jgi:hypothetical protein
VKGLDIRSRINYPNHGPIETQNRNQIFGCLLRNRDDSGSFPQLFDGGPEPPYLAGRQTA